MGVSAGQAARFVRPMSGRRKPSTLTGVRRWTIIGAVAGLALAAVLVVVLWPRDGATHVASGQAPAAPPVLVVDTPTPTPTPTVVKKTAPPHDHVTPAGPTHFLLSGPAFSISANVCAM